MKIQVQTEIDLDDIETEHLLEEALKRLKQIKKQWVIGKYLSQKTKDKHQKYLNDFKQIINPIK